MDKPPKAILHFYHFTGCCLKTHETCQNFMRREFQAKLLGIPGLKLVTAYSEPDLLKDLRQARHIVDLVAANAALGPLMEGVDPELLSAPLNVIRLSLHPKGLAPRIANLGEWHAHILDRLRRQAELTADPGLIALIEEIRGYPRPPAPDRRPEDYGGVAIPFQLMMGDQLLSMFGTTTVFGTPVDITLSELTLETFFPADAATAEALRAAHVARLAAA